MQALELISFSGNPHFVCNLICFWRFSFIFRRVSLACYAFVFWRLRARKKANFGCRQNLPFCTLSTLKIQNLTKSGEAEGEG
jgi:hypothetical protein